MDYKVNLMQSAEEDLDHFILIILKFMENTVYEDHIFL